MTQPIELQPRLSLFFRPRSTPYFYWFLVSVLLALVQISWAGYQLGVGNQGIQIPFLETLHDPGLFRNDVMVRDTLGSYPSFFFHICAAFLSVVSLPTLYFVLHLLTTAGVFWSVAVLSLSIVRDRRVALVAMLLLLAGHHQALAGETLYSAGFTHTWAVFPLSLLALALFYRDQYALAFSLAGVIFNLHALEAGHLVAVMGFVSLCRVKRVGIGRLLLVTGIFLVAALPTLLMMARQHQRFDAEWLQLMHIRSADHSFPSTWWQAGTPDIPRFLCIVALAGLALGYRIRPVQHRKTLLIAAAVGLLFLAGTVFTEIWPAPIVVRAQFFRSSRLLLVIAFILIAHGCVKAWSLPWRNRVRLAGWVVGVEFASAALVALTLAVPSLVSLLPWAVVVSLAAGLISARVSWYQALMAAVAMVVSLAAWQRIQFVIPGMGSSGRALLEFHGPSAVGWMLVGAAVALWALSGRWLPVRRGAILRVCAGVAVGVAVLFLAPEIEGGVEAGRQGRASSWVDVQRWAQRNTPVDALFLTPAQQAGFRIYSQRAIVGEMRDGTQLYFKADFAKPWWDRMMALQPGLLADEDGKSLLAPGKPLERLEDEKVIAVANQFKAQYIVLPHSDERALEKVYDNNVWAIYKPQAAVASAAFQSADLPVEDAFLRETALPNIDKNRKSDVQVQIVDGAGRPVDSLAYQVKQVSSAFEFGCSLPFFSMPDVDTRSDYKPPAVTKEELSRFLEVFNYSVIPFSGQWRFLEPARGKAEYGDLDQYVGWAAAHGVALEFHFVAGYPPSWFKTMGPGEQSAALASHARELVKRYGDRIRDWQVSADGIGEDRSAAVFEEMRKLAPHARLGIADDPRFGPPVPGSKPASTQPVDMYAGIAELRRLKKDGAQVDFFAMEARRPIGLWASGEQLYKVLDAFEAEGVPVHVTEFGIPAGVRVEGSVRDGEWTEQMRADYYDRFFTLCFSHPNVEAINVMGIGPTTWLEGQGLLDEKYRPTPAFEALKRLITQKWRTQKSGTLGLDGKIAFRGFHGEYELGLTLANGQSAAVRFPVGPDHPARLRFQMNPQGNGLKLVEGP